MRTLIIISLLLATPFTAQAQEKRAITVEDMWAMGRVGDPQLSPDGKWLAYTITVYDMERNRGNTDIWMVASSGGEPIRLTSGPEYDGLPRWRPDGGELTFVSTRSGSAQLFSMPAGGGEARQLSDILTGIDSYCWSPDGAFIAFSSHVYPETPTPNATAARDAEREKSKANGVLYTGLLYRHWNQWREGKRSNLFVMPASGDSCWNVSPGEYDTPPLSLGSAHDFCFSPDGKEIAFVRNIDPIVAVSTNNDIFLVPVTGGTPRNITRENRANDNQPVFSPDGKYIAYVAMTHPGFEADQYDLRLYDRATGKIRTLTKKFDRSVGELLWTTDGRGIFFTARNQGRSTVYRVDVNREEVSEVLLDCRNSNLMLSPDDRTLYFARQRTTLPTELFSSSAEGFNLKQLTFTNNKLLSELEMNEVEEFWFGSFDRRDVHGLLVKPPFFDAKKKYPLIFLIHGGPQGMWDDSFHYRWNAQMFAAPGYVAVMINFRGSKGYGQEFCDAVSRDWGGGPYRDLMSGLEFVLDRYKYIDSENIAAAGASYGGYMINWIAGHTDRFNCLVSHDGIFDTRSFYYATEELWFPEWEFHGTPYQNPKLYEDFSPSNYVDKFSTPTLVIHGQNDFRVPLSQGLQMYTALQRMGVPSQLLYFPDEDHFVTKPQNARLWWRTVFAWFKEWLIR